MGMSSKPSIHYIKLFVGLRGRVVGEGLAIALRPLSPESRHHDGAYQTAVFVEIGLCIPACAGMREWTERCSLFDYPLSVWNSWGFPSIPGGWDDGVTLSGWGCLCDRPLPFDEAQDERTGCLVDRTLGPPATGLGKSFDWAQDERTGGLGWFDGPTMTFRQAQGKREVGGQLKGPVYGDGSGGAVRGGMLDYGPPLPALPVEDEVRPGPPFWG